MEEVNICGLCSILVFTYLQFGMHIKMLVLMSFPLCIFLLLCQLYRDSRGHLFLQVAIIRILSRACFLAFDFHGTRFFHWSIYSKNDIPVRCKMMSNPLICKRYLTLQIRG